MRVAALYDIHGNLRALEAVLAAVDRIRPDRILVGGDVAAGPMPRQTLDLLAARGEQVLYIRGNADRELIEPTARVAGLGEVWTRRMRWTAGQLSDPQRRLLVTVPETMKLEIEGLGPTLFCHGTPRSDEEIITRVTPEHRLEVIFAGVATELVVCGHTHVQYDRRAAGHRIVNAGSVGMPYEGEPSARWAMLGPDVSLQRTRYDFESAAAEIRAGDYPEADDFVTRFLIPTPTAEWATTFFEEAAERLRGPAPPRPGAPSSPLG